jgi:hypothetical protein
MATSSNKQVKDLLTDDIYRILDIEDESDISSENLMIFGLKQVRKIQTVSQIEAVLCLKVNCMKKCQIFCNLLYLTVWRIQDLHFLA